MRRKKILLVDDSETILMLERLVLQPEYEVSTATDGRSGIAKAIADHPDLVILDLVMPGMTGLSVCRMLRREESTKQTPIVMVTSHREPQAMRMVHHSGCSAYLSKPINGPELLATVKRYLGD